MQIIFLTFLSILSILFTIIPPIILYLAIKLVTKHSINQVRKENNTYRIDFAKDKEYYRTILKIYSPAELSYIDDFKIDYKREIVSTLLSLELKGKIKIENDGIYILDNNDENLRKTEKFILRSINNKKVKILYSYYIELYAQDESIEDQLIIKNSDKVWKKRVRKKILYQLIMGFIAILIYVILGIYFEKIENISTVLQVVSNILSMVSFFIIFVELGVRWYRNFGLLFNANELI